MLKEEFVKRVGIQVSDAVFEKYNKEYQESDLDKDAFCKKLANAAGRKELSWAMQWEIIGLKQQARELKEQRDKFYAEMQELRNAKLQLERKLNKIAALINE